MSRVEEMAREKGESKVIQVTLDALNVTQLFDDIFSVQYNRVNHVPSFLSFILSQAFLEFKG